MTRMFRLLSFAVLASSPIAAAAGSGSLVDHGSYGTLHLSASFGFRPAQNNVDDLVTRTTEASRILWTATQGRLRIADLTLLVNRPQGADIRIFLPHCEFGDAWSTVAAPFKKHPTAQEHIEICSTALAGTKKGPFVIAHELGHYALGLLDEYSEAAAAPPSLWCDGKHTRFGNCFDDETQTTSRSHCIMQSSQIGGSNGVDWPHVYCTEETHDLDYGQCYQYSDPDMSAIYSSTLQRYEGKGSCWQTIRENYPFLGEIHGLPSDVEPPGFNPPVIIDQLTYPEAVMLVLDRSGSMALSTETNSILAEICDNGIDDDYDNEKDEADCSEQRIQFLKAGARALLRILEKTSTGLLAGAVSFSDDAIVDQKLIVLDQQSVVGLENSVGNLKPRGLTAIGDGLYAANRELAETDKTHKTIYLFSDGLANAGMDPTTVAKDLAAEGVTIHTIASGDAVNDVLLNEIAAISRGETTGNRNAKTLVADFIALWAKVNGAALVIPQVPYHTNIRKQSTGAIDERVGLLHEIPRDAWFTGDAKLNDVPEGAEINRIKFSIPRVKSFTLFLAGDLAQMSQFGVNANVISPDNEIHKLENPGVNDVSVRDPYFEMLRIGNPKEGEWTLEIWSERPAHPNQTGNITVVAERQQFALNVTAQPPIVDVNESVKVGVLPIYGTTLRDLSVLGLEIYDPAGGGQSYPVEYSSTYGYVADVKGLVYRGTHVIWVYAESGPNTYGRPGEIFPHGNVDPLFAPPLALAQIGTFFVKNGIDIAPTPVKEKKGGLPISED